MKHPLNQYSGKYINTLGGTLLIQEEKETLKANIGISTAYASPSMSDDAIRVEFRDGRGNDVLFISNDKIVFAAVYNGMVFLKE